VARGPAGKQFSWNAQILADEPNRRIEWRSVEGSDIDMGGIVRFDPAPLGKGTVLHVELRYRPPAGRFGQAVATLLGREPGQETQNDLRRFKSVMETGEVVTTYGQPAGHTTMRKVRERAGLTAQPEPVEVW
jgi:uncharacterized membrane protein